VLLDVGADKGGALGSTQGRSEEEGGGDGKGEGDPGSEEKGRGEPMAVDERCVKKGENSKKKENYTLTEERELICRGLKCWKRSPQSNEDSEDVCLERSAGLGVAG
jgi:hypothetical protein